MSWLNRKSISIGELSCLLSLMLKEFKNFKNLYLFSRRTNLKKDKKTLTLRLFSPHDRSHRPLACSWPKECWWSELTKRDTTLSQIVCPCPDRLAALHGEDRGLSVVVCMRMAVFITQTDAPRPHFCELCAILFPATSEHVDGRYPGLYTADQPWSS